MEQNKRYYIVKTETLVKLLRCFSSQEEFHQFLHHLNSLSKEMNFIDQVIERNPDNDEAIAMLDCKKLFILSVLIKENIELIHEMIKVVEYKEKSELTEEEIRNTDHRW